MATITIVGLGPGPVAQLTREAEAALLGAEKIFFRTGSHPVHDWLRGKGKHVVCFDKLYTLPWKVPGEIYDFIVSALLKEAMLQSTWYTRCRAVLWCWKTRRDYCRSDEASTGYK